MGARGISVEEIIIARGGRERLVGGRARILTLILAHILLRTLLVILLGNTTQQRQYFVRASAVVSRRKRAVRSELKPAAGLLLPRILAEASRGRHCASAGLPGQCNAAPTELDGAHEANPGYCPSMPYIEPPRGSGLLRLGQMAGLVKVCPAVLCRALPLFAKHVWRDGMAMGSSCMDTGANVAQVRLESQGSRTRTRRENCTRGLCFIELMEQRLSVIWILYRTGGREDLKARATDGAGSRQ